VVTVTMELDVVPDLRSRDVCVAFVFGPWGGIGQRSWKGVRIWGFNVGFVGVRVWRGDLPGKVATEVARLVQAVIEEGAPRG